MRTHPSLSFSCLSIFLSLFFCSCATTAKKAEQSETVSAVEKVLTAVSGEEVDEKRLRQLDQDMKNDPETRSAVETITNSMSGQGLVIKYCPKDGERYSAKFELCPIHKVPLEILSD